MHDINYKHQLIAVDVNLDHLGLKDFHRTARTATFHTDAVYSGCHE